MYGDSGSPATQRENGTFLTACTMSRTHVREHVILFLALFLFSNRGNHACSPPAGADRVCFGFSVWGLVVLFALWLCEFIGSIGEFT